MILPEITYLENTRSDHNISQERLAEMLECSKMTYWRMCTGKGKPTKAIRGNVERLAREWGYTE